MWLSLLYIGFESNGQNHRENKAEGGTTGALFFPSAFFLLGDFKTCSVLLEA
jgi:hypothetical protein